MAELLKFAFVGGSGTLLNLALFCILVDREGMDPSGGVVICFAAAVTSNYLLNHYWTFRARVSGQRPRLERYLLFVAVSLAGLGANLGVLNLVLTLFHPAFKVIGQAAGIACGMVLNYTGSSLLAFRGRWKRGLRSRQRHPVERSGERQREVSI